MAARFDKLLAVPDVANFLNVTERTVYTLIRQRKIPCYKVGGVWRFKPSEIERWLTEQRP